MTNSIFETKQQYLSFRAAFAAAQNDKRAKHYFTDDVKAGKIKHNGWLQAEHFILLNAIRRKPLNRGFTPITNENKIGSNWGDPCYGFNAAHKRLIYAHSLARSILSDQPTSNISAFMLRTLQRMTDSERAGELERKKQRELAVIDQIIGPFNGSLTIEQFASLDVTSSEEE